MRNRPRPLLLVLMLGIAVAGGAVSLAIGAAAGWIGRDTKTVVVKAAAHLFVEFSDRDRVPARVVGWDVYDDVGLIRVDPAAHRLTPVPLGASSSVVVGQPVAAIGSPLGNADSLSVGVVSATHRAI